MNYFEVLFQKMAEWGMVDFFFPWMLFTALIYGILQNKKYVSDQTSVNGVIAVSSAFIITYLGRGAFLTNLFWISGIFMLVLLLSGLIGGLFGLNFMEMFQNKSWLGYVALGLGILAFLLALVVTSAGNYFGFNLINWGMVGEIFGIIIAILAIVGVLWVMSKGGS